MAKIFLSFKSAIDDLTPEDYLQLTIGLSNEGFIGDSKVRLIEGSERFHFNNIIIHAASLKDALIAEKFGIRFFGEKLEATGRGFDVAEDKDGKNVLDWNNFLCTKSPSDLPAEATNFLKYN